MINLCLVVIATQFSETKKREMERMRIERARFHSSSTLASTNASSTEPSGCYGQLFKYLAHLGRRTRRRFLRFCKRKRKSKNQQEDLPCSISLRRRKARPKWQPGQSNMKNNSSKYTSNSTTGEFSSLEAKPDSPMAPVASPEISDIDLVASPRGTYGSLEGVQHQLVVAPPQPVCPPQTKKQGKCVRLIIPCLNI